MSTEDEIRLDAFRNKFIRKILHINWKLKKSNEYIRGVTKQLSIQEMLRKRRLRYCGHLAKTCNELGTQTVRDPVVDYLDAGST